MKHGKSKSREYASWRMMMHRCHNPKMNNFANYGGRGIKVCERWKDFLNFLADMGPRPIGTSVERKDNSGDYEKGNCMWATRKAQGLNKRNNVFIHAYGVTLTQSQWADRLGVSPVNICSRLKRGWTPTDAVTVPFAPQGAHAKDGKFLSNKEPYTKDNL